MAATDITVFPPKNTAYRCYPVIRSLSTGNPLTGGLTGLGAQISKDGGAFANTTNAPVENSTTGYCALDLTATEMNASAVVVRVFASNTGAIEWPLTAITNGVTQMQTGLATSAALSTGIATILAAIPSASATATAVWSVGESGSVVGRPTTQGGLLAIIYRYLTNKVVVDKNAQTITLYGDDNVTVLISGSMTANAAMSTKGKMT